VLAFHDGRIGFLDILAVVQAVLDGFDPGGGDLDRAAVLDADRAGRDAARRALAALPR
jgi:1-deoxy-D-xylulose-5-phosphate reductoisomerase